MTEAAAYFWSGGRKLRLSGTDDLAVVVADADLANLSPEELGELRARGRPITDRVLLVPAGALSADVVASLRAAGAIQPVFRSEDALIVVLPEVRIEERDPTRQQRLEDLVAKGRFDARVVEARRGRMTLYPRSGRGEDALRLANELVEELHPDVAQARFLRITQRPDQHPPRD